jgi:hypothetical protein
LNKRILRKTHFTDKEDDFNAYRTNFISPALDQLFAGGTQGQQVGGAGYERARLSYFGRVAYNYKEKYLAEFLWREDGSYLFPENRAWFATDNESKIYRSEITFIVKDNLHQRVLP